MLNVCVCGTNGVWPNLQGAGFDSFRQSVRLSHLNIIMLLLLLLLFAAYIIVLFSHLVFMQLNPY
jgi:hypothetical protein